MIIATSFPAGPEETVNLCFAEFPDLAGLWSHQVTWNIHDSSLLIVLKLHAKHLLTVKKPDLCDHFSVCSSGFY